MASIIARAILGLLALLAFIATIIGPDRMVFDYLLPHVPGEKLMAIGVYVSRGICLINQVRKALLPSSISKCELDGNESDPPLRVLLAVQKGGSVMSARVAHSFGWECGWCPAFAHNQKVTWPSQSDDLPTYPADVYLAVPSPFQWDKYAFSNSSRRVTCVMLTRDPFKRFRSLFQYAWEGGEPALWDAYAMLHKLKTWKERVDWAWSTFGRGSMEVSHAVLKTSIARKECIHIRFEDFTDRYDDTIRKWLKVWEVNERMFPRMVELASSQDLNRLTPEQQKEHNHMSGFSLSAQDKIQIDQAFKENADLMEVLTREKRELNYSS